jgi:hypothetical protein
MKEPSSPVTVPDVEEARTAARETGLPVPASITLPLITVWEKRLPLTISKQSKTQNAFILNFITYYF